ncbi:MAG: response regulator transcription factor [Actinomycetota bacterium]|nr:response regulator transcription factor [Actinomycetota bacterium]
MTGADQIRIIIADDQDLIRAGLRAILEADPGLTVVAEASDGAQAARLAREHDADVVLMDVQMPGTDGLAGVAAVGAALPRARVIMLTMYDVDDYVAQALRAGASGFLLKTTPPEELTAAIRKAHAGQHVFGPSVTDRLVRSFVTHPTPTDGVPEALRSLTERELEVFDAIARGLSNAEIGASLYLTEATVKTYVTRILAKLGLRDRVQAVILAFESGRTGTARA